MRRGGSSQNSYLPPEELLGSETQAAATRLASPAMQSAAEKLARQTKNTARRLNTFGRRAVYWPHLRGLFFLHLAVPIKREVQQHNPDPKKEQPAFVCGYEQIRSIVAAIAPNHQKEQAAH